MRRDQQLTKDLIKSRIKRVQKKCRFLSLDSSYFFQLSLGFSLVLDIGCRLVDLGGKVGSACEEFEDNKSGILG